MRRLGKLLFFHGLPAFQRQRLWQYASKDGMAVAVLLALFVCRGVLASVVVPPWQGPDEPTHFALAAELALPPGIWRSADLEFLSDRANITNSVTTDVQRQVLESMARHRFWEPYGVKAPDPLPELFVDAGAISAGTLSQPLYYGLAASMLRVVPTRSVDQQYAVLRMLSVALSVFTLVFGWAGTRALFGSRIGVGAMAVGALHPQFLLVSIAVNPDVLVSTIAAFMWWQLAMVMTGQRRAMSCVLLVVAAAAALLTKRSSVPFVGATMLALMSLLLPQKLRAPAFARVVVGGTVIAALGLAAVLSFAEGPWTPLMTLWRGIFQVNRPIAAATPAVALEYLRIGVDYAWLMAGWQRFAPPAPWLWTARILTLTGAPGALLALVRCVGPLRQRLALAWLLVFVQVYAVIVPGFWSSAAPQGRYLFSVLAPIGVLLWLGIEQSCPASVRPYAGAALVGVLAVMDVIAFTAVLFPAYVPYVLYVP